MRSSLSTRSGRSSGYSRIDRPVSTHPFGGPVPGDFSYEAIDVAAKCDKLGAPWQPRVIAELNDYQFKVAKLEGDFVWHAHPETDEAFFILHGKLRISAA